METPGNAFSDMKMFQLVAGLLLLIIIAYGVAMRIEVTKSTVISHPIRGDAIDYYHYAYNLKHFATYSREKIVNNRTILPAPDALRSPGFPYFASKFLVPDLEKSVSSTLYAQTILQIVCFLIFSGVLVHFIGIGYSLFPVLILWTFPHFSNINTYYLTESLFLSSLLIALSLAYSCCQLKGDAQTMLLMLTGFVLGLSSLIRPVMEYFPAFLFLVFCLANRKFLKLAAVVLVTSLIPILFWKSRNYFAIGELSDSTLMINALYHGSFPDFMFNGQPESYAYPYRFDPRQHEVYQGIKSTLAVIFDRFVESPAEYLYWYLVGKQFSLWQWGVVQGQGDIFIYPATYSPFLNIGWFYWPYRINFLIHNIWMILGLFASLVIALSNYKEKLFHAYESIVIASLVYVMLIHILIAPFPRYGSPFKVLVIIMLGVGSKKCLERFVLTRNW